MTKLDGAGKLCAETDYFYDETAPVQWGSQATTPPASVRGNLTTIKRKLSSTPCAASATWTDVVSHNSWFDTGELPSAMTSTRATATTATSGPSPITKIRAVTRLSLMTR